MSAIYEERKDEDGFLYITYSGENTFGADADVRVCVNEEDGQGEATTEEEK